MKNIHPRLTALLIAVQFALSCPAFAQQKSTVIFEQPSLSGVKGNLFVPQIDGMPQSAPFRLNCWQPNPWQQSGHLLPSDWNAGSKTGFYPQGWLWDAQVSYRPIKGSSTVQIWGDTVGVYLNSKDLPNGSSNGLDKMMVCPEVKLSASQQPYPFSMDGQSLVTSIDLQVPTAVSLGKRGDLAYVTSDAVFLDRKSRTKITYEGRIFRDVPGYVSPPTSAQLNATIFGGYDKPANTYQLGNWLEPQSQVLTLLPTSATWQTKPWIGWKRFKYAVTKQNFANALQVLKKLNPNVACSMDPADYYLTDWHLNAELNFSSGQTELGWSMRNARITLEK